jgi:hypothetical protein
MIWARLTGADLTDDPARPKWVYYGGGFPLNEPLITWVRSQVVTRQTFTKGTPTIDYDSGWPDEGIHLDSFNWPLSTVAFKTTTTTFTSKITVRTAGRAMPCKLVFENKTTTSGTIVYATVSTDLTPGEDAVFEFTAATNQSISIPRFSILMPTA